MSRKFLYSRLGLSVMAILMLLAMARLRSAGQGKPELKRPQETPDEKPAEPKKTKKVKGPRAVGLLQFGLAKTTLIPVAILVDGKFYDASVYKADPVPMALETGTVYEAEKSGESQGLFTTNGALHSKSEASVNPWLGTGTYLPHGTEAHKTTHKAEDVPVGLDNSGDEPPRLTRKSGASSPSGPAAEKPSTDKPKATESSEKGSTDNKSSSGDATKGAGPPSDKTGDQGKAESPGSSAAGQGSSGQTPRGKSAEPENYYRPTLRRGKPTQAAPEEDELAAKTASSGAATGSTPVSGGKVEQFVPAISDSGGPDPQSYQFFWKEGEEEERRKQMLVLAEQELRAYLNTRAKGTIPAAVPGRKAEGPRRKAGAKLAAPAFENIRFRAFDVWKNNQPVMILSAEGHFPPGPGMATAPEIYSITLVSRTDIYGSLRKLYSGVTDRFHLDVTPRLELIDVVDADGDGRGELLFREVTDAGKGYVIYRATGDKLWKMFDSAGGE